MANRRGTGLTRGYDLAAPLVSAAEAGMVLSSSGLWVYPPGFLEKYDKGTPYTGNGSTTPETSILTGSAALAGVFRVHPTLGAQIGDKHVISVRGRSLNNSGTNTFKDTIACYFGAYQLFTIQNQNMTSNASPRPFGFDVEVEIDVVGAANTGQIKMKGLRVGLDGVLLGVEAANTPTWYAMATNNINWLSGASPGTNASLVTNAAQAFNVTSTHSSNTASMTTTLDFAEVRYYPAPA